MIRDIYLFTAALLAASMLPAPSAANEAGCVTSFDKEKDYFPDKVKAEHNAGFDITYKGNAKYIRNNISGENYVLYQCGTPAPADANPTPVSSSQVGNWTKVAAVPGAKVALDSAPASAIIELLGIQDAVSASYKFLEVTSPCMQKRLDGLPRIEQNFGTPSARKRDANLVRRVSYDLADSGLQWTFTTYGMSDPRSFAASPENASDMLGKAEWIKFIAAFFNKEAQANKIFSEIEARYNSARQGLQAKASKKTVGFARYNKVANGTVTSWAIDQPQSWLVQGLADAGLAAHSDRATGFADVSSFHKAIAGWDILVDLSMEPLPHGGATIPQWKDIRSGYRLDALDGENESQAPAFLATNAIYRTDLISSYKNATDYNEHLQVQVDELLADFGKLAASESGATDTKWFRNLPHNAAVDWSSADDCKN
ncbi:hypothetical protein GGF46_002387 [Coemansia sp. RSA 552]|nr:hypothetical protein GGF46_002387 [Coemansia sp. RSA 552]